MAIKFLWIHPNDRQTKLVNKSGGHMNFSYDVFDAEGIEEVKVGIKKIKSESKNTMVFQFYDGGNKYFNRLYELMLAGFSEENMINTRLLNLRAMSGYPATSITKEMANDLLANPYTMAIGGETLRHMELRYTWFLHTFKDLINRQDSLVLTDESGFIVLYNLLVSSKEIVPDSKEVTVARGQLYKIIDNKLILV